MSCVKRLGRSCSCAGGFEGIEELVSKLRGKLLGQKGGGFS